MYIQHAKGMMSHPHFEWLAIKKEPFSATYIYLFQLAALAAIPALSLFIGSIMVGWRVAGSEPIILTADSALPLVTTFYLAMLIGIGIFVCASYFLEKAFSDNACLNRCLTFAIYASTPIFLSGLIGLLPVFWLDVMVVLTATCYSLYLLYDGTPAYLNISKEKGSVFLLLILSVGLCTLAAVMIASVIIWGSVLAPQFAVTLPH